jgi:hypothetical protein
MRTPFLENKAYAFTLALIAVLFQSGITILIISALLISLYKNTFYISVVGGLLFFDVLFVVFHLLYRILYRGQKVVLHKSEKKVLVVHVVGSLLALTLTGALLQSGALVSFVYIWGVVAVWVTSLISGGIFFKRKYFSRNVLG